MTKLEAIFFDLDGTVCNTLQDLAECTNRALADFGLPPHPVEAYRMIVGNGVDTQMKRAIGEEKYSKPGHPGQAGSDRFVCRCRAFGRPTGGMSVLWRLLGGCRHRKKCRDAGHRSRVGISRKKRAGGAGSRFSASIAQPAAAAGCTADEGAGIKRSSGQGGGKFEG